MVTWVERRTQNDNTVLLGIRGWVLGGSNDFTTCIPRIQRGVLTAGGDVMLELVRVTIHVSVFKL